MPGSGLEDRKGGSCAEKSLISGTHKDSYFQEITARRGIIGATARGATTTLFTSVWPVTSAVMNQARFWLNTAYAKVLRAEEYAATLEVELDIHKHWDASTPQYQEFHQQNVLTSYSKAIDDLECLVVMRLFELEKMSSSGTGEHFNWLEGDFVEI